MLVEAWGVATRDQSCERSACPWLGHNPQAFPQQLLRGQDRLVADKPNRVDKPGRDSQGQVAHLARRERVNSHAAGWSVDRRTGIKRCRHGWRALRFDAED